MTPGILITEDQPCPTSPGFLDNDNVMNTDNTVSTHLKPTVWIATCSVLVDH